MIKLLIKIFLTELLLTIIPIGIFGDYFDYHLRADHPILDVIDRAITIIFCQGFLCLGGLLFLGLLYIIWAV